MDVSVLIAAHCERSARDMRPRLLGIFAHHIDARRFLIIDKVRGEIHNPLEPVSWVDNA